MWLNSVASSTEEQERRSAQRAPAVGLECAQAQRFNNDARPQVEPALSEVVSAKGLGTQLRAAVSRSVPSAGRTRGPCPSRWSDADATIEAKDDAEPCNALASTCIYVCVPKSEDAGLGSVDFLQKVAALSATSENVLVKGLVAQLCAPCLRPDADAILGAKSDAKPSDVPASQCRYGCPETRGRL